MELLNDNESSDLLADGGGRGQKFQRIGDGMYTT